jgi:4-amino-4-deoxy-L-arabinose transferase-like glycosyltransferase
MTSIEMRLVGAALVVYAVTRFIALDQFPLYFFSDEAVHTVRAAELALGGGRYEGGFLPTYFQNGPFWNLSVSVYAQVLPYLLFGKSVVVTRATSVFITLLAALAVGLVVRDVFKQKHGWTATLLLGLMPVWFLHSRTAFETAAMTAFYAVFLYAYLRYRTGAPHWLYAAAVCGALAFYTYSPGQIIVPLTAMLWLVSDWRYHWQQRATVFRVALLLVVLALPYLRFQLTHPEAAYLQLRQRGVALLDPDLPLADSLWRAASEYALGLSPFYWYAPENGRDIVRHLMVGYGNLPWWTALFALIGLGLAVRRFRSPEHRALLLALLAAPAGGALTGIGNTRVLAFVIPATLITALGLVAVMEWLARRWASLPRRAAWIMPVVFIGLTGVNGWMLGDALVNGPRWTRDFGLYGLQYGAPQIFGEAVPRLLARDTTTRLIVSPSWANGTGLFVDFFVNPKDRSRLELQGLDYFRSERRTVEDTLIILPRSEYESAVAEPKFDPLMIDEIIPYPDGSAGFYVVRLTYSTRADSLFAAEAEALRQPVVASIELDGQLVNVTHSRLDGGTLADILDDDPFTLGRGLQDNPLFFDFRFPGARTFGSLSLTLGSMESFTVRVKAFAPGAPEPWEAEQTYERLPTDPVVTVPLTGAPREIERLIIEITDHNAETPAHIHVREIVIGQ